MHALTGGHLARLERRGDPDRLGVRVASAGDAVDLELHLVTEWGASILPSPPGSSARCARTWRRWSTSTCAPSRWSSTTWRPRGDRGRSPHRSHRGPVRRPRAASACGGRRAPAAIRASATAGCTTPRTSSARGASSTATRTGVIGLIQYGPRAGVRRGPRPSPAGPPSRDAVLVTCAYLTDDAEPMGAGQPLPGRHRRVPRPRGGPPWRRSPTATRRARTSSTRFLGHRTIFPAGLPGTTSGSTAAANRGSDRADAARPAGDRDSRPSGQRLARLRERLAPLVSPTPGAGTLEPS